MTPAAKKRPRFKRGDRVVVAPTGRVGEVVATPRGPEDAYVVRIDAYLYERQLKPYVSRQEP